MTMYEDNPKMAQANARAEAIRRLCEMYEKDWDRLYAEERVARGMPAAVASANEKRLKRENAELKAKLREAGLG